VSAILCGQLDWVLAPPLFGVIAVIGETVSKIVTDQKSRTLFWMALQPVPSP
jgi:hypothetical protein